MRLPAVCRLKIRPTLARETGGRIPKMSYTDRFVPDLPRDGERTCAA